MNSNREKITNIVMVGVFAAVLAVLSQISFPLPSGIPVTLQTFAVALCGYALGCKRGTLAVLVYIVLGAVGLRLSVSRAATSTASCPWLRCAVSAQKCRTVCSPLYSVLRVLRLAICAAPFSSA